MASNGRIAVIGAGLGGAFAAALLQQTLSPASAPAFM
jgi:cation diffusion facilitator CzcD-associated flavoprotein CzcO